MNPQQAKKLEAKVLATLQKYVKKTDKIVAGISGGPDSVFLLHILSKLPNKTIVAHINHNLRKEAKEDEEFVKNLAKKFGMPFEPISTKIATVSRKTKQNLEEAGRNARYKHFKNLASKYKAKFIATAHHADDNLETIIMNLVRGASHAGLAGMQELEKIATDTSHLFRPLLDISKKEITSYLKLHKIPYRTDKTNRDTKLTRNYIRHEIIPKLEKINPNLAKSVAKNATIAREITSHLSQQAKTWISRNQIAKSATSKITKLPAKSFRKLAPALQKQILRELHELHTTTTRNLESVHIDEVLEVIHGEHGNKKKKLGKLVVSIKNSIISVAKS